MSRTLLGDVPEPASESVSPSIIIELSSNVLLTDFLRKTYMTVSSVFPWENTRDLGD